MKEGAYYLCVSVQENYHYLRPKSSGNLGEVAGRCYLIVIAPIAIEKSLKMTLMQCDATSLPRMLIVSLFFALSSGDAAAIRIALATALAADNVCRMSIFKLLLPPIAAAAAACMFLL